MPDHRFPKANRRWRSELAQGSLYQGSSGIGIFLFELYVATGDSTYLRTAKAAMRHAVYEEKKAPQTFGFHAGRMGVAYALARFSAGSGSDEFVSVLEDWRCGFRGREQEDTLFDLLSGAAGGIVGALLIAQLLNVDQWHEIAYALGNHLLRSGRYSPWGLSWCGRPDYARDLVGLAHGTAGIAHALLELNLMTGDKRFKSAALRAIAYEDTFLDHVREGWLDFRHPLLYDFFQLQLREPGVRHDASMIPQYRPTVMHAWCHGAPGIALARLSAIKRIGGEGAVQHSALASLALTRQALVLGPATEFGYCHGIMGLIEVLLDGSRAFNDAAMETLAIERASSSATEHELGRGQWPCGQLRGASDPSLMLGEAGIGYFFLRQALPTLESVLLPCIDERTVAPAGNARASHDVAESSIVLGDANHIIHQFFRRTGIAFGRLAPEVRVLPRMIEPTASQAAELIALQIEGLRGRDCHGALSDVFALEERCLKAARDVPYICDDVIADLSQPQPGEVNWQTVRVRLRRNVQLTDAAHDWDTWCDTSNHEIPLPSPCTYAIHSYLGRSELIRLAPLAALVLRHAAVGGVTLDSIKSFVLDATVGSTNNNVDEVVRRQVVSAFTARLIELDPCET